MYTKNYDFPTVNVIKIIVVNKDGKVLLIQEPETNDWMPLHWGLVGGKPTLNESLEETFNRKAKTDVGQDLEFMGLMRAYELLVDNRTVVMFIAVAEIKNEEISGEIADYKWVSKEDVKEMKTEDFTEYYNKQLLSDYFEGKFDLIPFSFFETLEFYKMSENESFKSWLDSGTKK